MLKLIRYQFFSLIFSSLLIFNTSVAEDVNFIENITSQQELQWISEAHPIYLEIMGRRLIDPHHWDLGRQKSLWPAGDHWQDPETYIHRPDGLPHLGYGENCFQHWMSGYIYVLNNFHRLPQINDYLRLHDLSFYNSPGDLFWGYYRYQIWTNYQPPQREKLFQLLNQAQNSPDALKLLFSYGIKSGRGRLRTEGDSSWSGKPWSSLHQRSVLYTEKEFQNLSRHSLLRPEIQKVYPDGINGRFWHPPGKQTTLLLQNLFQKIHTQAFILSTQKKLLDHADYRKKGALIAAEFYIQLLVIHGLWDGVGRSSKLIRDWLLRYLGLQAPANTPINDMEMTAEEYAPILEKSIVETEQILKQLYLKSESQKTRTEKTLCENLFIKNF
jgi:hypothetical protein